MIFQAIFDAIYDFLLTVVALLPVVGDLPGWIDNTYNVLSWGLMFFPKDVFYALIGSFVFWMAAHFAWAIIEWIYKKIPGVD